MLKQAFRRYLPQKIQLWLIVKRQALQTRLYRGHVVKSQYGGYTFDLHIADRTAEWWYALGRTEIAARSSLLPEFSFLQKHRLAPGAVVFDAGAHQCVMALILASLVGPHGKVIALEANPHNAYIGNLNRNLNNMHHLHVLNVAVADKAGIIKFLPTLNGHISRRGEERQAIEVTARTIDDLSAEYGPPDVLFIDVEGFEQKTLQGATHVLRTYRPDCFVEVHLHSGLEESGGSVNEVLGFFSESDYELYVAQPNNTDYEFRRLQRDSLPEKRFFLIAVSIQEESKLLPATEFCNKP